MLPQIDLKEKETTIYPSIMPSKHLFSQLKIQRIGISMFYLIFIIEESDKVSGITAVNLSYSQDVLSGIEDILLILDSNKFSLNFWLSMMRF